jgi:hypothetical protein
MNVQAQLIAALEQCKYRLDNFESQSVPESLLASAALAAAEGLTDPKELDSARSAATSFLFPNN